MTTRQRKASAKPEPPPASQSSWRQTPVKPRSQANRNQATMHDSANRVSFPVHRPDETPSRGLARRLPRFGVRLTWRSALAAATLAIVACALGQAWLNDGFRVHAAQVRGATRIAAEEIYQASAVDGRSIFQIRPASVAAKVNTTPGVASSVVHLRLPAEVIIDVREHQPWIAWKIITDTVWLAADGVTRVPVVGPPPALTLVDETGSATDGVGQLKPYVFASLKTLNAVRPELAEIHYGRLEGLFYRAAEGWTVYLGDTGKMAPKLALLQAVQDAPAIRNKRPEIIDLRFDGRAEIR